MSQTSEKNNNSTMIMQQSCNEVIKYRKIPKVSPILEPI